jgi:hypothetical protein
VDSDTEFVKKNRNLKQRTILTFEVLTVEMSIVDFWVMTPYGLVAGATYPDDHGRYLNQRESLESDNGVVFCILPQTGQPTD